MPFRHSRRFLRVSLPILILFIASIAQGQGAKQRLPDTSIPDSDADHVQQRNEWFFRGRLVPHKPSAELRRRAYQAKLQMRAQRAAALAAAAHPDGAAQASSGSWTPLGPAPLASDATGNHTQDYGYVAGRATAVAIDPADSSGNTIYIGGAQSGVWRSTNGAVSTANSVVWTPVTDDQATLSIGALAIQPGNADPAKAVILAATGEADNSGDSYFGLGILRSTDAGNTWTLVSTANGGALSFSGLGGTRMAFSTASTVVAAMATTSEGMVAGAVTANTQRGLYTSLDAGQSWTYDAILDPGSQPTDATSATSVIYNAVAGKFFAAIRYHGFYSSPDGVTWTRLATQPGNGLLSSAACPPQSTSNNYGCPIYRAELTAVPNRNEMYAWYISLDSNGNPIDQGIRQSLNGGTTWTSINDTAITNCGDSFGCGVEQGFYNLELLAVPNCPSGQPTCSGNPTDLYAGAINLYKCSINPQNPTCATSPFLNLTHVYGCNPIAAPAHVHPDQHALANMIPTSGTDSGNALLYFANDGGIYRALNGFSGLNTGSCSGTNQFDDLNQNLGSMTQFVSFSQHPSDPSTLLGGTQDNGSPATHQANGTNLSWINVLGGDGGYNAIDPNPPTNFYASNPDIPPGGLGIQLCSSGVNCDNGTFNPVVTSSTVGGDDGAFYFPYILDSQAPTGQVPTALLVGTCRVWRGPRTGGSYTALSPNFDTLGTGSCSGSEVNQVRAIAAGGATDGNGSLVIYATTSGDGPIDGPLDTPAGGHVWFTGSATSGPSIFVDVTNNGPQGSINPNQFPISSVAIDSSDKTGYTAYVTVMGFTGGSGHVWKTTNGGASWTDFTGNLPDAPANAIAVDPASAKVYVATDVGAFLSSTAAPAWTELGPVPSFNQPGFLPNVAVTALALFNSGGEQLLRASTYGRGVWQFNLTTTTPDYQLAISNSPQTVVSPATATFNGTATALNGWVNSVALSCVAGVTKPPSTCTFDHPAITPSASFKLTAGGSVGDYYFNVQGQGSDSNQTTHQASVELHILCASNCPDFSLSLPNPFPLVNAGSTTGGAPLSITALNGFNGTITLTCSLISGTGSCSVSPITTLPSSPTVTVNASALSAGSYQLQVRGTSGSTTHLLVIPFNVGDYTLSSTQSLTLAPGTQGTATLTITPSTYYTGRVNAACDPSSLPGATCTLNPANPIMVSLGSPASFVATINAPMNAASATYTFPVNTRDTSGAPSHSSTIALTVAQNFLLNTSTTTQTVTAGQTTAAYNLTIQPAGSSFTSPVTLSCSGLPTGTACAFNPSTPVTPGSSSASVALTISTGTSTSAGTYSITVTATSGPLSHSTTVSLVVSSITSSNNDFQLAVTQPFGANIDAGSRGQTATVSVTSNYIGSVNATCDASAMQGAQCIIPPPNPVAISPTKPAKLTVTLNLPNTATPAQYNINLAVVDASGEPSHTLQLPLTVIEDFTVSSSTPTQTATAGQTTGPYQLAVAPNPQGSSFPGAVALSCPKGLPSGAQCIFNPSAPVGPGNSSVSVVMTISTTAATAALRRSSSFFYAVWLLLPGIAIGWVALAGSGASRRRRFFGSVVSLFLLLLLPSCGGVSSGGGGGGGGGTPPGSYAITVTGTSSGVTHSTQVALVVN